MKKITLLAALIVALTATGQSLKQGTLSNVKKLTNDVAVKYENPQWSPDGMKVAYTEFGFEKLYVVNADGTAKRRVSNSSGVGHMYQWSADSREILVRDTRWTGDETTGVKHLHAGFLIDIESAQATRVTDDAEYMQPAAMRYSPAGAKSVASIDAKARSLSPAKFKPVSKALLAAANRNALNLSFYIDAVNDKLYLVDENGSKRLLVNGLCHCPVLSPDGTKAAFVKDDQVCVINVNGTGMRVLSQGFHPAWVGNNQLVFEKTTDDGHTYTSGDLFIINVNGSSLKQLTKTSGRIEMNAAVSPDGSKVAFTSFTDGQVYVADLK